MLEVASNEKSASKTAFEKVLGTLITVAFLILKFSVKSSTTRPPSFKKVVLSDPKTCCELEAETTTESPTEVANKVNSNTSSLPGLMDPIVHFLVEFDQVPTETLLELI